MLEHLTSLGIWHVLLCLFNDLLIRCGNKFFKIFLKDLYVLLNTYVHMDIIFISLMNCTFVHFLLAGLYEVCSLYSNKTLYFISIQKVLQYYPALLEKNRYFKSCKIIFGRIKFPNYLPQNVQRMPLIIIHRNSYLPSV